MNNICTTLINLGYEPLMVSDLKSLLLNREYRCQIRDRFRSRNQDAVHI